MAYENLRLVESSDRRSIGAIVDEAFDVPGPRVADAALEKMRALSTNASAHDLGDNKILEQWLLIATLAHRLIFGLYGLPTDPSLIP